jgi:hypothetical protein
MIDNGNGEESRRHDHTHMCPGIGFAEPVRMLEKKRSFLKTWQCLGEVRLSLPRRRRMPNGTQPCRTPRAARTSGVVRSDDAEQLLTHGPRLIQTSLPTYSFTRVGNYAFPFLFLVSPPRLPAYSFTSVGRYYALPFYLLKSSPSMPTYPFTGLTSFHVVYSRNRMTCQTKAQQDTTRQDPDDFWNSYHGGLLH